MEINDLKNLFTFKPAYIGSSCKINGGELEFYYALHSIPCVGIICRYGGKSIYFSADTFYDPQSI